MRFYRIADTRYALDNGEGARLYGGRWNSPGRPVIYACETFSGALLEKFVHTGGRVPKRQVCVTFEAPDTVASRAIDPQDIPQWDSADLIASRAAGDAWLDGAASALLFVPSVVFSGERNVLINPAHPDSRLIVAASVEPVKWDDRLFVGP